MLAVGKRRGSVAEEVSEISKAQVTLECLGRGRKAGFQGDRVGAVRPEG